MVDLFCIAMPLYVILRSPKNEIVLPRQARDKDRESTQKKTQKELYAFSFIQVGLGTQRAESF